MLVTAGVKPPIRLFGVDWARIPTAPHRMTPMPWLQIVLHTDRGRAERYSDRLEEAGAQAVSLQDAEDDPLYEPAPGEAPLWERVRVSGLFAADRDPEAIMAMWTDATGQDQPPPWSAEVLPDQDWTRAWMERFVPMRFGTRLWVCPGWASVDDPGAVTVLLDPGLAFGTGTHPTTALCLEWLDRRLEPGLRVVDYGCGSGILAIAAARLGASRVQAVDNDPQALIACRDNARRNRVEARIETYAPEDFPAPGCAPADLVLANILAGPLIELAPRLAGLVRPGGRIVLSGILEAQAEEVREAYHAAFRMQRPVLSEGWTRLEGVR